MGLNKNKGQEILLRLRTDDLQGFRKYDFVLEVLWHELAHNRFSEHNAEFFNFMSEIKKTGTQLDWTRSKGRTVGKVPSEVYHRPYDNDEDDGFDHSTGYEGGAYTLGSDENILGTTVPAEADSRNLSSAGIVDYPVFDGIREKMERSGLSRQTTSITGGKKDLGTAALTLREKMERAALSRQTTNITGEKGGKKDLGTAAASRTAEESSVAETATEIPKTIISIPSPSLPDVTSIDPPLAPPADPVRNSNNTSNPITTTSVEESETFDSKVTLLLNMGFDYDAIIKTLEACEGNVNLAVSRLI